MGEAEITNNFQQQKKKLRKKSSSKLKNGNNSGAEVSMNGKSSSTSNTTSDSEQEENKRHIKPLAVEHMSGHAISNKDMNGSVVMAPVTKTGLTTDISSTGAIIVDATKHYGTVDDDLDASCPQPDEEFREVHRRKKVNHKQQLVQKERNKPSVGPRVYSKPNKDVVTRQADMIKTAQPKAIAPETVVDLSLNSFPVLESQNLDSRSSLHTESTRSSLHTESATDDDRDSVVSQSSGSRTSWATIAAKPTSQGSLVSAAASKPSIPSHTDSPVTVEIDSAPSYCHLDASASGALSDGSVQPGVDQRCPNSDDDVGPHTAASLDIEFGTVLSGPDSNADQHVHNILSQSFTEGQTLFKLRSQPKTAARCSRMCSNDVDKSNVGVQKSKTKGVEFVDEHPGQTYPDINIVFGFGSDDELAQARDGNTPQPAASDCPLDNQVSLADVATLAPPSTTDAVGSDQSKPLPQPVDILPYILAARPGHPSAKEADDMGCYSAQSSLNMAPVIKMLRKGNIAPTMYCILCTSYLGIFQVMELRFHINNCFIVNANMSTRK